MAERTSTPIVNNLPVSVTEAFAADDVALILGTCLPEAVFVMDEESRAVVAGNLRFLALVGVDQEFLETQEYSCDQLIHSSDRAIFDAWQRSVQEGEEGSFEIRILKADGAVLPISMQLKQLRWKRRSYLMAFLREVSALEGRVTQLKQQVEKQKERAFEAIKSSLRLYQLNEKIKRTPQLAKTLLNIDNEEKLFDEAARILTSEEGIGYKDATFLLVEENALRVVYSTNPGARGTLYPLNDDHRFSQFIRNSFEQEDTSVPSILVPMQSRGHFVGIFEVISHNKEKQFFDESSVVVEWQKDVLHDIGGILALLIDNLRLNREIKRQSIIDPLTQTYNRHYFVGRLAAEVRRAKRYSRPTSLIFLDVDKFKDINDKYGHLQGDQVLRDLGRLFLANLRDVDVVCRYGGDEFVLLLPETDLQMAEQTAEKIRTSVVQFPFTSLDSPEITLPVTVSIGVSALDVEQNEDQFLQQADEALYTAKRSGRNRVAAHAATAEQAPEGEVPTAALGL